MSRSYTRKPASASVDTLANIDAAAALNNRALQNSRGAGPHKPRRKAGRSNVRAELRQMATRGLY